MDPATPGLWSLGQRIAFRFCFAYLVLYNLPFPAGVLPGTGWIAQGYDSAWHGIVAWIGKHVLHLEQDITIFTNGSGDTTYNYLQCACFLVLAVIATIVWTLLDRRRTEYEKLHDWLRVGVRFVLASTMLGYGMSKVIKLQFPDPSDDRMMQSFGDASPMGLLWTFMGASTAYTFFAGAMEVVGGVLLFFRRTTTVGALVVFGVMLNVVMLNYCYDVPVKLYSTNLLFMAMFLFVADMRSLVDVMLLHRPTRPRPLGPPPGPRWLKIARRVAWVAFVGWVSFTNVNEALSARSMYGSAAKKPLLYGVYDVEEFSRNGVVQPLVVTEPGLWRRVGFNAYGGASIRCMDDTFQRFLVKNDEESKKLRLTARDESKETHDFDWSQPDAQHLVLVGKFKKDTLSIRLRKLENLEFFLMKRGFHWINEYPLNR